MNQLEKCEELDKAGLIYWSKNKKPYFKRYLPENPTKFVPSLWNDIKPLSATSKESLGYPTQRPLALLERILEVSSNKGDVILDPFCGCGTAVHAAEKLHRKWLGIDITHLAIWLIEYRMRKAFGVRPVVNGVPTTLEAAKDLARRDKFQFEAWAAARIDGTVPNKKNGGDKGIGGLGHVHVGPDASSNSRYEKVIVSVKGGQLIGPSMVRDLKGTAEREGACFWVFVCIKDPTLEMKKEASSGSIVEAPVGTRHPKIQIYTIGDYFEGKLPDLPHVINVMQSPAPERRKEGRQTTLPTVSKWVA